MMAFFNFAKADLPYLQLTSEFHQDYEPCDNKITATGNLLSREGCPSSSYCIECENSSMYFELGWISDVAPYTWTTYSTSPTFTNVTGEVEYEFDVPYTREWNTRVVYTSGGTTSGSYCSAVTPSTTTYKIALAYNEYVEQHNVPVSANNVGFYMDYNGTSLSSTSAYYTKTFKCRDLTMNISPINFWDLYTNSSITWKTTKTGGGIENGGTITSPSFDLSTQFAKHDANIVGEYEIEFTVQSTCLAAPYVYKYYIEIIADPTVPTLTHEINGSTTVNQQICSNESITLTNLNTNVNNGNEYRITLTKVDASNIAITGSGAFTTSTDWNTNITTNLKNLPATNGDWLSNPLNGGYYRIFIEAKAVCGSAPNQNKTLLIELIGAPDISGNYEIGKVSGGFNWNTHGTSGNLCSSPILTCENNLYLGNASSTYLGTISGVKMKLEKLTSGTLCDVTPTYTTVFDGSNDAVYTDGGSINSWASFFVSVEEYALFIGEEQSFEDEYQDAITNGEFKLTLLVYGPCNVQFEKIAYIEQNLGGCKTDGETFNEPQTNNEEQSIQYKDLLENSVYPNPVKNILYVESTSVLNENNIKIMNTLGQTFIVPINKESDNKITLNVENLNNGVYFIINGKQVDKFIKE